MLRTWRVGAFAALLLAGSASAAISGGSRSGSIKDAPEASYPYLWDGFYAGVNGGYAWGGNDGGNIAVFDTQGTPYATGPLKYDLEAEGGFAGVQVGFSRQSGNIVLGIEADIQTSLDDRSTTSFDPPAIFNFDYRAALDVEWFSTVRARLGYAFDRTLVYVTGGLAFGEVSYKGHYLITEPCCSGGFANPRSKETETGYALGAGLEHAISPNWSLKLEYQYVNLGEGTAQGPLFFKDGSPSGEAVKSTFDVDFHTVRVGINYRFQRDPAPLK